MEYWTKFVEYYVISGCYGWQRRFHQSVYLGNDNYDYKDKDVPVAFGAKLRSEKTLEQLKRENEMWKLGGPFPNKYPGYLEWELFSQFLANSDNDGNFKLKNEDGVVAPGKICSVEYTLTWDGDGQVMGESRKITLHFGNYVALGRPPRLKSQFMRIDKTP